MSLHDELPSEFWLSEKDLSATEIRTYLRELANAIDQLSKRIEALEAAKDAPEG